ncbi:hypothetical protein C8F04DRAFT_1260174 [Mycena alexandri]|uniref:Uncharacterized protein n=1 Tax=Mycena alexandri TaxID=1745969 RepID=A0AAD6SVI3_9AGAR|nr:hypothetical protein C8F04DRAFT_1260174 [Mycena alexandri]
MADPLSNLRAAYGVLETRVNRALRTQLGDTARLRLQRDEAFRLLESAEPHRNLFSPAEFATLQQSISAMADRLDEACHLSTDPQASGRAIDYGGRRLCHRKAWPPQEEYKSRIFGGGPNAIRI